MSFVSVTQQFNTTTSMGRLMLNVLLSFAQFEREVTGERIRDKITASKRKGMWMGGVPPIGYEVKARKLVVVEKDAKLVRRHLPKVRRARQHHSARPRTCARRPRTRVYASETSRGFGGKKFSGGHLHRILRNRMYIGEVVHQGIAYPGRARRDHRRRSLVRASRRLLAANRIRTCVQRREARSSVRSRSSTTREIGCRRADEEGYRRYRYYVSRAVVGIAPEAEGSVRRVPAHRYRPSRRACRAQGTRWAYRSEVAVRLRQSTPMTVSARLIRDAIRKVVVARRSIYAHDRGADHDGSGRR